MQGVREEQRKDGNFTCRNEGLGEVRQVSTGGEKKAGRVSDKLAKDCGLYLRGMS